MSNRVTAVRLPTETQGKRVVRKLKRGADELDKMAVYECLDYDANENLLYREQELQKPSKTYKVEKVMRWVTTLLIGMATGIVALLVDVGTRYIALAKFDVTLYVMSLGGFLKPLATYVGICTGLALIAAVLVVVEPMAGGSGIPEVKSYLNGVRIPRLLRFRTLMCKMVGVVFAVTSGMAVGKEGPMIHCGAICAAGLSQGKTSSVACDMNIMRNQRCDHEKRDMVSCGAAAGVAAGFGAPIGGVLFSLEEGASFWSQQLTWRCFFCAMMSSFTLNFLLSGLDGQWGNLSQPGLVYFGSFFQQRGGYRIWEVPFFAGLGIVGGLLGAIFNALNSRITACRRRFIGTPIRRAFEAVIIALITSAAAFSLPYLVQSCVPGTPSDIQRQFYCPPGTYSDVGTVFFNSQEIGIQQLFHNVDTFSYWPLASFLGVYFVLTMWTHGAGVPQGLFVPSFMIGAAFGRLVGTALHEFLPYGGGAYIDPGVYAMIGAASMMGGLIRTTISITVIVIESTNDITYGLPIMTSIIFAKWVGDLFNSGIYEIHIEMKHIPFLEWQLPRGMRQLAARHVMATSVVCFRQVERVRDIYDELMSTKHNHNGFPVVRRPPGSLTTLGVLYGLILRTELTVLLSHPQVFLAAPPPADGPLVQEVGGDESGDARSKRLVFEDFLIQYPHFPDIRSVHLTDEQLDMWLDLGPYMNLSTVTVHEETTLSRVFQLVRTLGLRHVCVVNQGTMDLCGIITRKDLMTHRHKTVFARAASAATRRSRTSSRSLAAANLRGENGMISTAALSAWQQQRFPQQPSRSQLVVNEDDDSSEEAPRASGPSSVLPSGRNSIASGYQRV